MSAFTIRPFVDSDLPACLGLARPGNPPTGAELETARRADAAWNPRYYRARYVAEDGAEHRSVVGWGEIAHVHWSFHPDKYHLRLEVAPARRRQGAGGLLLERLVTELRGRDALLVRALASEENVEAIDFLTRRGFCEVWRELMSRLDVTAFDPAPFAGAAERADACYVFVLCDGSDGRIVGISAIEAAVGLKEPWYNYRVGTLVHASRALGVYTAAPTLFLANDHTGHSELCSLFLDQAYRHGKNGALLSKSRLMFIAEFAERFAPKIIAELRGRLEPDGRSPFWEGLGRHFFAMEYSAADYLTGIGQKSFIAELMPRHPVYVNLLPPSAREAIAAVHVDTAPARAMLEQEGFRYEGYVDIFDAGPTVECFRENVDAVRRSQVLPVVLGEEDPVPDSLTDDILWLVANRMFDGFRALVTAAPARVDRFPLMPYAAAALGVDERDTVRAVPLAPRDR